MTQQLSTRAAKWQRPERTEADLNKICGDALRALKIPTHWKFKLYERTMLELGSSEIQSITALFLDTRTSSFGVTNYRINFHTYSERLSIVEVTFKDYGKPAFSCKACNRTPEQMNEFLKTLN